MKSLMYFFFELIENSLKMVSQPEPVNGGMINLTGAKQKHFCKCEIILQSNNGEIRDLSRLRLQ